MFRQFSKINTKLILRPGIRSYAGRAYLQRVGKQPLTYRNLSEQIKRAVDKYGKRTALISIGEAQSLTFEEAHDEAQNLALRLHELGLPQGAHLAIWAPNTRQWYITCLAAALGGYTLVCLNPALQGPELSYALNKAKVQAVITMSAYGRMNFYGVLNSILPQGCDEQQELAVDAVPALRWVLMHGEQPNKMYIDYKELLQRPSTTSTTLTDRLSDIAPESPCNIQFTSGTTGQPKAALLTHFALVNRCHLFGSILNLYKEGGERRICLTVPFFHAIGLGFLFAALDFGNTLVLPSATFNAAQSLDAIEREACHLVVGTPTMFVDMLEQQQRLQKNVSSLERAFVGGAACSPEIYRNVKSVFGVSNMHIGYGQSEATGGIMTTDGSESEEAEMLSVGKLLAHGEAKVINKQGDTVAFGEPGELCLRGYFTMQGYYDDDLNTRQTLDVNGWLKTGDEFILHSNGLASIVGRQKDMIIRGGENIFPKELEDFFETHADILEAQVIGVPDERLGEEICAYLRLKANARPLTSEDLRSYCKGKLAYFKEPRYVRILEEFPKTASGKVQKFKLLQLFKAEQ